MKKNASPRSRPHPQRHRGKLFRPLLETLETREQVGSLLTHFVGMSPLLAIGGELPTVESRRLVPFATDSTGSRELSSEHAEAAGGAGPLSVSGARKNGALLEAVLSHSETSTPLAGDGGPAADGGTLSPWTVDLWGGPFDA